MSKKSIDRCKLISIAVIAAMLIVSAPAQIFAEPDQSAKADPVQVYDMGAEKVTKIVPNNAEYQRQALSWLHSATGLAVQLDLDEKCGYIYKVPLERTADVDIEGVKVQVNDVFLIHCPHKKPLLLVFSKKERKPYLLVFKADIKPFLELIHQAK